MGESSDSFGCLRGVQLVNSTGTILRTDEIPESGQTNYSITYAAGDLRNGNFTVRVTSDLTGVNGADLLDRQIRHRQQGIRAAGRDHLRVVLVALDEVMTWITSST
jgi:hypothetical protein